jgi:hypothetical protein
VKKPAVVTGGATVVALALIVVGAATARPEATTIKVSTAMNAAQEVPAPTGNVAGARGTFTATVTKSGSGATVGWTMRFSGLTGPAGAAHIHTGGTGQPGGVAVALCGPCTSPASGTANADTATLAAIQNGGTYVNVHTATNAAGEIRGQLAVTAAIKTTLNARQEVPRPSGNVSRATGTFTGTVTKSGRSARLSWRLTFARLTGRAVAAHIHIGARGRAGGVAIALCGPCRSGVQRQNVTLRPNVVTALEAGRAYVNVHTGRNPAGEIRGQIAAVPLTVR